MSRLGGKRRRLDTADRLSVLPQVLVRSIMAFATCSEVLLDWPLVCKSARDAQRPERDKRFAVVGAMVKDVKTITESDGVAVYVGPVIDHLVAVLCVLQLDLPMVRVDSSQELLCWAYAAMAWRGKPTRIVVLSASQSLTLISRAMDQTADLVDNKKISADGSFGHFRTVLSPLVRGPLFLGAAASVDDLKLYHTPIDVVVRGSVGTPDDYLTMAAARFAPRAIYHNCSRPWSWNAPVPPQWPLDTARCTSVFNAVVAHVSALLISG